MFIAKKHIHRRTVLKAAGVSLALPFLDAMVPAGTVLAQTAAVPKLRTGFFYIPHGAIMRISYNPPPNKEGTSALHGAVQAGRTDLVRYLLEKGATPELIDANGKKPIDLLDIGAARGSAGGAPGRGGAPASGAPGPNTAGRGAGGRGGAGEGVDPVTAAEIRALLRDAAAKK